MQSILSVYVCNMFFYRLLLAYLHDFAEILHMCCAPMPYRAYENRFFSEIRGDTYSIFIHYVPLWWFYRILFFSNRLRLSAIFNRYFALFNCFPFIVSLSDKQCLNAHLFLCHCHVTINLKALLCFACIREFYGIKSRLWLWRHTHQTHHKFSNIDNLLKYLDISYFPLIFMISF